MTHGEVAFAETVPAAHATGVAVVVRQDVPAPQKVHDVAPTALLYVPTGHAY